MKVGRHTGLPNRGKEGLKAIQAEEVSVADGRLL